MFLQYILLRQKRDVGSAGGGRDEDSTQVEQFWFKVREDWLIWFGNVQSLDSGYLGQRMLNMELPGRRKIAEPQRGLNDVLKEDTHSRILGIE